MICHESNRTTLTLEFDEVITSPLAGSLMWQFLGMRFLGILEIFENTPANGYCIAKGMLS
jgi:hypothetical protein